MTRIQTESFEDSLGETVTLFRQRSRYSRARIAAGMISAALLMTLGCLVSSNSHDPLPTSSYAIAPVEGLEEPPVGELNLFREIVAATESHQRMSQIDAYCADNPQAECCRKNQSACRPSSGATRDAHAKGHGCVAATWESSSDVPADLAVGVFSPGARFDALIRFSNADPHSRPDSRADGRGMAIKLMGVPGPKLFDEVAIRDPNFLAEEKGTQDFVMINHAVFFIPDVATYQSLQKAADSHSALKLLFFFVRHPRLLGIVRDIQSKKVDSLLTETYHSMAPYLLGSREAARAVKYMVEPVECDTGDPILDSMVDKESSNDLRGALSRRLSPSAAGPACFDFAIVHRRDEGDSIEDATDEWDTSRESRHVVSRITIPEQRFESADQLAYCENLSFSVWHALPAHQPLGGLNRLRLGVYRASSKQRHALNHTEQFEPKVADFFQGQWPDDNQETNP